MSELLIFFKYCNLGRLRTPVLSLKVDLTCYLLAEGLFQDSGFGDYNGMNSVY